MTGVSSSSARAIAAAMRVTASDPGLWLLGALSFCVRGGVLLILLPMLWIPSPVLLSVYLGRFITTSGISADAVPVAASVAIGVVVALVAAILLAAYAQIASFERISANPDTAALRHQHVAATLTKRQRLALVLQLAGLQLVGLVPALLLLPGIGLHIGDAALAELQLPTSTDTPLIIAILERVQNDLLLLVAVMVAMDLLVAVIGHRVIARRLGLSPRTRSLLGIIGQPLRAVFLGALAWLVTAATLALTIGASLLVWNLLHAVLFHTAPATPAEDELLFIGRLVALAVFGVLWVAAITLAGFASSLRGALWTTNALH